MPSAAKLCIMAVRRSVPQLFNLQFRAMPPAGNMPCTRAVNVKQVAARNS